MPVTFGTSGVPNQVTVNLDALFASTLANYQKTLFDNITKSNIFFYEANKRGLWEAENGGAYIQIPLMYGLATPDAYSGYDTLSTQPTDGLTAATYLWAQAAVPVTISGLEELQNRLKIVDLIKSKIIQSEMGIKEWFTKAFLQGSLLSGGSSISSPYVSNVTGASFINPLFALVNYQSGIAGNQPTQSLVVGGIQQSSSAFWRNWTLTSAATTTMGFLLEMDQMYDLCSRGPGGPPNIIWTDETTKRLLRQAYFHRFRTEMTEVGDYPFDAIKFRGALVVSDEFMIDVESALANTNTFGTAVFLNSSFIKMKYDPQTNFTAGDFKEPLNQDAKVKQILWYGQSCIANRRKCGVIGKIARTLTVN